MSLKSCVGCGALSENHPIVAIVNPNSVPEGVEMSTPGPNGFVAVRCCQECYEHPEHRVRNIKGHFFLAQDEPVALFHAGNNSLGGA